jgi:hypothetical protein
MRERAYGRLPGKESVMASSLLCTGSLSSDGDLLSAAPNAAGTMSLARLENNAYDKTHVSDGLKSKASETDGESIGMRTGAGQKDAATAAATGRLAASGETASASIVLAGRADETHASCSSAPGDAYIDVINSVQAFSELRSTWEAVYAADPEAQFFLSWTWMSSWLKVVKNQWFILAAKPCGGSADHVAFFPLRLRSNSAGIEIAMAGNRAAEYTGFICKPEFLNQMIPAFAKYITQLDWTILNLEFFRTSEGRFQLFLDHFPKEKFYIGDIEQLYNKNEANNCICPYVKLPSDCET